MCGILTSVYSPIPQAQFQAALDLLEHRGPDDRGIYNWESVQLGHRRLSIIDLKGGRQPLSNRDESLVLVCNGEIYEHEKWRRKLEQKGHQFRSESDSEVILHLYAEYGLGLFQHLRGEFAFILLDKKAKKVIAARDRFGIKPLFFARAGKGLVFASEAKSLFATGVIKPEMDPFFLRNFYSMGFWNTPFQGVEPVAPASYMVYSLDSLTYTAEKYWQLELPNYEQLERKNRIDFSEAQQKVSELLDEAVRIRMRADVPVGVFLSGGIDSSAILATIKKQFDQPIKAFTISFSEDPAFDELSLAKKMASFAEAELYELKVTEQMLLDNFEEMLWYTEMPTHNMHGVGKFLLSKLAREHVTVCLTGEGGDEVFLGYNYFKIDEKGVALSFNNLYGTMDKEGADKSLVEKVQAARDFLGFQPLYENVEFDSGLKKAIVNGCFSRETRKKLAQKSFLEQLKDQVERKDIEGKGPLAQLQYYSIRFVLGPYILSMLGDRQEMAHSLEGRTPLLDHKLFEYVRTLPKGFKIGPGGNEKMILKEVTKERVIPEIFHREKWSYFAPQIPIRRGENPTMDRLINTYLSASALEKVGVFSVRRVGWLLWLTPWFKWLPEVQYRLDNLLTFILSVQIIGSKFQKRFENH